MEPQQFDQEVAELEVHLERLRALYEQYFLGIERIEPTVARKAVDRLFWQLKRVQVRNTARRFRFQNLVQRYNTLQQHWTKVCRQIENGTYVRHLQRAQRRIEKVKQLQQTEKPAPEENPAPTAAQVEAARREAAQRRTQAETAAPLNEQRGLEAPAVSPSPPRAAAAKPLSQNAPIASAPVNSQAPPHAGDSALQRHTPVTKRITLAPLSSEAETKIRKSAPPPTPANSVPGADARERRLRPPTKGDSMTGSLTTAMAAISEERVGGLYHELQRVRRRLNQGEMEVSMDALGRSLRATEARLKAKYAGKRVDFRVEIHDGKAVIKPTVKR